MKDFKTKGNLSSVEQKRLVTYLIYTFGIAWGTEILLIALYHLNLLSTAAGMVIHFLVIGFGVGMASAYAAFLTERTGNGITFKAFFKGLFRMGDSKTFI